MVPPKTNLGVRNRCLHSSQSTNVTGVYENNHFNSAHGQWFLIRCSVKQKYEAKFLFLRFLDVKAVLSHQHVCGQIGETVDDTFAYEKLHPPPSDSTGPSMT